MNTALSEPVARSQTGGSSAPRFHWLRVDNVRRETPDAISVSFDIPAEYASDYQFRAGQYLTVRTTLDGEEVRRSYSICSGVGDGELRIAIKKVEGGVFSVWAQEALKPGVSIEVMTPTGRFGIPALPPGAHMHVGFAAGSGITPVLSIMTTVLTQDRDSRFVLFYGSRSLADILFRSALEDLKDRFLGRLSVVHVLSREQQDIDVLNGRLDHDKLRALMPRVLGGTAIDAAYVCGPFDMIDAVEAMLAELAVPSDRVHVERFSSALSGRPRAPRPVPAQAEPHAVATIVLDGKRKDVPVLQGEAVLDAALRTGLDLPFSCKGGMCSTCRAKVLEGAAVMELNYSLEPWELQAGFTLTCQARPTTARIIIDYDQQ